MALLVAVAPWGERNRRVLTMVGAMDDSDFGGCINYGECEAVCPKAALAWRPGPRGDFLLVTPFFHCPQAPEFPKFFGTVLNRAPRAGGREKQVDHFSLC